jgi:hypothetical protein
MNDGNNNHSSLNLISNHETPYEKNKIPYKKFNYKTILYKKRIKYGIICKTGLVNEKVRFLPYSNIGGVESQFKDLIKIPDPPSQLKEDDLDNNYLVRNLFYNPNFNFNIRKSKRELKLNRMLSQRIKILNELTNSK